VVIFIRDSVYKCHARSVVFTQVTTSEDNMSFVEICLLLAENSIKFVKYIFSYVQNTAFPEHFMKCSSLTEHF